MLNWEVIVHVNLKGTQTLCITTVFSALPTRSKCSKISRLKKCKVSRGARSLKAFQNPTLQISCSRRWRYWQRLCFYHQDEKIPGTRGEFRESQTSCFSLGLYFSFFIDFQGISSVFWCYCSQFNCCASFCGKCFLLFCFATTLLNLMNLVEQ